ncbi:MAG: DUF72 domain-containing protein [Chthoniobacter sp.]
MTRQRFSQAKFERECLAEYAETFSTVCVDAGYYQFPTPGYLAGLCEQVPERFKFAFKVTDEITIKNFPGLPRFGARKGMANTNFLTANPPCRLHRGGTAHPAHGSGRPSAGHRYAIQPGVLRMSAWGFGRCEGAAPTCVQAGCEAPRVRAG